MPPRLLLIHEFASFGTTRRWLRVAAGIGLFCAVSGSLVACGVAPTAAPPEARVYRVGVLTTGGVGDPTATSIGGPTDIIEGMRERGYVEGQNVTVEVRSAAGDFNRLPSLAAELVDLKVDVIYAVSSPAIQAAMKATSTIPIVMAASASDPVASGFVASLDRPGGNVTGLTGATPEVDLKRLQLLVEALPGVARVGILGFQSVPSPLRTTGQSLGVELVPLPIRGGTPDDYMAAFAVATREQVGAILVVQQITNTINFRVIANLEARARLPAIHAWRDFADAGGLMAYEPNLADANRRVVNYLDKILKGARPADLPVERPSRYDFVINLRTAHDLGLTIPQVTLVQASEVIQ